MDAGSILLILSLALIVGWVIVRPFFDGSAIQTTGRDKERSSLLAERERILEALKELDFDFTLGKISEGDYPDQRDFLVRKGVAVLERLDALGPETQPPAVSDAVEKAIADRRAATNGGPRQPIAADDEIERLIASRRRELAGKPAGFCHQCGQSIHQSDKFCSKCGASLN
ncbi:MAG TPA: zinc ribbon domain-containing protein [Anaerolineales bacterium]|nr:zinc ribbon domain-containing protein [Anaerolineales bacterium]